MLKALRLPKTGQTYELGHIYDSEMPQYGYRPYFLNVIPAAPAAKEGTLVVQQDYFTGFIGQMGTQFDALGHQGRTVRMVEVQRLPFLRGREPGSPGIGVEVARWAVEKRRRW